jgi:cytochrome c oxidase cbb3-type subunit 1
VLGIEFLFSLLIHWTDESRHSPSQFLGLASLLIWGPLIPWHYMSFRWDGYARPWRNAVFFWWVLLIPMGWALFQVPVLERLKFTDGLVAHSLLAMAGFVTSLLFLLLSNLLKEDSVALSSRWAFYVWQGATLIYVLLMLFAGWVEGADPTFTIVPGTARNLIYTLRLLLGTAMTIASAGWFFWLTRRLWTASATENAKRSAPEKLPLAQIQLRAGLAPS